MGVNLCRKVDPPNDWTTLKPKRAILNGCFYLNTNNLRIDFPFGVSTIK